MEQLFQQIAAGLANGAIYALLALALVMIFVSTNHINFAQGEMAMFSAFICWQFIDWGYPFWIAPIDKLPADEGRSEEHTSELQSQSNLLCRLLLEKKEM